MSAPWLDVIEGRASWCVVEGDNAPILQRLALVGVDHVITDPPYDARTHSKAVTAAVSDHARGHALGVEFGALADPESLARGLLAVARRWVIAFCTVEHVAEYARGAGKAWVRAGVWDKVSPAPQITGDRPAQAVEAIAIMHRPGRKRWNGGGRAGIWRHRAPQGAERPEHPTPKPVPLMLDLIRDFTEPGDLILDPFCGSGSTGEAAILLGRRFIGVELDPRYAALARERLDATARGLTLADARAGQIGLFEEVAP